MTIQYEHQTQFLLPLSVLLYLNYPPLLYLFIESIHQI